MQMFAMFRYICTHVLEHAYILRFLHMHIYTEVEKKSIVVTSPIMCQDKLSTNAPLCAIEYIVVVTCLLMDLM